jgi:integrase/recombinase XerD
VRIVLDTLYKRNCILTRQLAAPLLKEREQYLTHKFDQGVSEDRLQAIASTLLHIVRIMKLTSLATIEMTDVQRANDVWMSDTDHRMKQAGQVSGPSFKNTALDWFRFHDVMTESLKPARPVELIRAEFMSFMRDSRGMAPETVRGYGSKVAFFLSWVLIRRERVSLISIDDVEDFLSAKRNEGYKPRTLVAFCGALRTFFQYAEIRGWSEAWISTGIQSPQIPRPDTAPKGPKWKDVRRLLDSSPRVKTVDLRATAILSLCSIYGIRSTEVVNFMLNDFDWINETFTVRRAKRGRVQQFPIQFEVGEKILRYLQYGRPRCSCRNLFVTLKPPYRPMQSTTLWGIVSDRLKHLKIDSEHYGAHSLRHACATELLRKGSSLREIADFLGHRTLKSVSIYAKYDVRFLRQVANFSLAGVK